MAIPSSFHLRRRRGRAWGPARCAQTNGRIEPSTIGGWPNVCGKRVTAQGAVPRLLEGQCIASVQGLAPRTFSECTNQQTVPTRSVGLIARGGGMCDSHGAAVNYRGECARGLVEELRHAIECHPAA